MPPSAAPRRRPEPGPAFADRRFDADFAAPPAASFERCEFQGAAWQSADLSWCRFVECRFASSNLSVAKVEGLVLQNVGFRGTKLVGIDWTAAARASLVAFEDCVLDECAFVAMDLRKLVLRRCRARGAVFADADLEGADLSGSDFDGAHFARTKLAGADLRGARGYVIDPRSNDVKGLRVSMPEAAAMLLAAGIDVTL